MGDKDKINHNAVNSLISLRDAADLEVESIEPAASYDTLSEARQSRTFKSMTVEMQWQLN